MQNQAPPTFISDAELAEVRRLAAQGHRIPTVVIDAIAARMANSRVVENPNRRSAQRSFGF